MSTNAGQALRHLTAALEAHLEAVSSRRSPQDAAVDDAFDAVAEAFERYEEVLDQEFGESLPMILDDLDGFEDAEDDLDDIDPHAQENEDELDDDIEDFDLN